MNIKSKLTILRQLNERHSKSSGVTRGFTLIELMIVVAILGVLSAVAVPQFLGARNSAEAGAAIGEALGLAKECATFVATRGIGMSKPDNCELDGGEFEAIWSGTVENMTCLNSPVTDSPAIIKVSPEGKITCGPPE